MWTFWNLYSISNLPLLAAKVCPIFSYYWVGIIPFCIQFISAPESTSATISISKSSTINLKFVYHLWKFILDIIFINASIGVCLSGIMIPGSDVSTKFYCIKFLICSVSCFICLFSCFSWSISFFISYISSFKSSIVMSFWIFLNPLNISL